MTSAKIVTYIKSIEYQNLSILFEIVLSSRIIGFDTYKLTKAYLFEIGSYNDFSFIMVLLVYPGTCNNSVLNGRNLF